LARRENRPRGVIDTSVLVAGIAGFKSWRTVENPSASFLRGWIEHATFTWLVSDDIVSEYKEVPTRLGVRRNLVGEVINLLREEAEFVDVPHNKRRVSRSRRQSVLCLCGTGAGHVHCNYEREGLPSKEAASEGDLARGHNPYNTTA